MIAGVVGLGLIGGSLAGAYKRAGDTVYGIDTDRLTQDFAVMAGSIDGILTDDRLKLCEVVFIAITPQRALRWLTVNSPKIGRETIVIDCCGIKRRICEVGEKLSDEYGFSFVGGHPMAGKQVGGYKNSRNDLFDGAGFAIVPKDKNDIRLMTRIKQVLRAAGFAKFAVMTAKEHDEVIAYTSQMAHILSSAYIKGDVIDGRDTFAVSGGAFRDMTRVAYIDEDMWTELFLENRDNLTEELTEYMTELGRYLDALKSGDAAALTRLLREGKERKREVEGEAQALGK